jgi:DNA ligase-1
MKLPPLYSRRSDGKVQIWEKEVDGPKHRSLSGILDGEIVTAAWTVCTPKNVGRSNEVTADAQALSEAKSEWQKKKDKGYKEDVKDIDTMLFFEPMLAKVWQDYRDKHKDKVFYVQPKLDGLRLIGRKEGLYSRNGKEYKSIPHIYEALKPLFDYNPAYIFDGEVYADKFASDFDSICSLARKTKPTSEDLALAAEHIEYHIYDFPWWDDVFSKRHEELKKVLRHVKHPALKLVATHKAESHQEIDQHYESFVEAGYEGLMVRLDTKYENKRTDKLLKYKEFQDAEYEILDVLEGVGNKSGGAGSIVCRHPDGRSFNSNIKGSREYCRQMLADKDKYIGKIATVKFFNLTPDNIPRFPYFMRLREAE